MQRRESRLNAQELLKSLSYQEKERIDCVIRDNALKRKQKQRLRLENAETEERDLIHELEIIEYKITKNDEWFVSARDKKINTTSEELSLHRNIAKELFYRKKEIKGHLLPSVKSKMTNILSENQREEKKESFYQQQDLETQLELIYDEQRCQQNRILFTNIEKERIKEKENRSEEISLQVRARKIPYLVHFTPVANLFSILQDGFLSRNALAVNNNEVVFSDEHRIDSLLDWISFSLSFPNYKMFYSKRNSRKDIEGWVVLLIKHEVLWKLNCNFFFTNAACSGIKMFREEELSSVKAFKDMFGQVENRTGIPEYFTTDPQAEVMIKDKVPIDYIDAIAVENKVDAIKLKGLTNIRIEVIPQFFKPRMDFKYWQKKV